jgi:hypothetical protein
MTIDRIMSSPSTQMGHIARASKALTRNLPALGVGANHLKRFRTLAKKQAAIRRQIIR